MLRSAWYGCSGSSYHDVCQTHLCILIYIKKICVHSLISKVLLIVLYGSVSAGQENVSFMQSLCVTKPGKMDSILQFILDICIFLIMKTLSFNLAIFLDQCFLKAVGWSMYQFSHYKLQMDRPQQQFQITLNICIGGRCKIRNEK